jgi:hypothetical protein
VTILDRTETKNEFLREHLQFVATSPTSGNRIAVVFTHQRTGPLLFYNFMIKILEKELLDSLLCAYSPDSPKEVIEAMLQISKQDRNIVLVSLADLDDDNVKLIGDHFADFDNRWRRIKRDLQDLSKPLDDFKQTLATIMKTTQELRLNIQNAEHFRDTWRDVVDRVAADVRSEETIYKAITNKYYNELDELVEQKNIPDERDIPKIYKAFNLLKSRVSYYNRELDVIKEEFSYVQKHDNRYSRYGLQINPFVFTVPFRDPNGMLNEDRSRTVFDKFIHDVASGSENRTLIIADEAGKGKTHLMYYFNKLITDHKYGKILPLYINCQPRYPEVDFIDLYSQIISEVKRWESIIDQQSVGKLQEIVKKGGPRDINEFLLNLRNIFLQAYELGYSQIILMIDEFENMLPENRFSTRPDFEPTTLLHGYVQLLPP